MILPVPASSSISGTPVHWTLYFMYTLVTPDTVISCACIVVTQILLYWTLLFHVYVPLIHGYAIPPDTVISYICITDTRILCTHLFLVLITLLHRFIVYMRWLILYSVAWITVPATWIFMYSYYMTISCYWYRYDIRVTWHVCCWYAMCETKCYVDLSHGVPVEPHISNFSFFVILFHDINKIHVLLSYYMYHSLFLFLIHCVV